MKERGDVGVVPQCSFKIRTTPTCNWCMCVCVWCVCTRACTYACICSLACFLWTQTEKRVPCGWVFSNRSCREISVQPLTGMKKSALRIMGKEEMQKETGAHCLLTPSFRSFQSLHSLLGRANTDAHPFGLHLRQTEEITQQWHVFVPPLSGK